MWYSHSNFCWGRQCINTCTSFVKLDQRDMRRTIPIFSLLLLVTWVCWWVADDQLCPTPCEGPGTLFPSRILCPYFLGLDLSRRSRRWNLNALGGSQTVCCDNNLFSSKMEGNWICADLTPQSCKNGKEMYKKMRCTSKVVALICCCCCCYYYYF